jgi:hypothetical protein
MDNPDPTRAKLRRESDDPSVAKSKTDIDPTLEAIIATADPNREKLLMAIDEPRFV